VAREAGVGLATASRALSGHPSVAAGTRQRVLEAAELLGYRPNLVARAFSQQRTHTLEAIVPLVTHYLYVEVLRGVEVALTDTDYSLVIRTVERQDDRERAFAACCLPGRADGALVVSMAPPDDFVKRLAAAGLPAALVDAAHPRLPAVVVDHTAAAGAAVRFCRELGHRRIALIDRAQDPFAPIFPGPRQRGYRAALAEAGLSAPPEYERVAEFSPEGGATSLDALLALPNPPTAVLTGSDVQAMGALDAARRRGVRVPDDLSVVGYNDVELTQYLGLTTVHVPMRELGRQGGELLLAALAQPEQPLQRIELPTELIVRRTTAPPRSAV
jgi:DNA-binding LacI/PurR family transcriptional regulator